MRLNGEISHREGEGEGEEEAENEVGSSQKVVVGYALTSKKKKSFLQPKFLSFASCQEKSGVRLLRVLALLIMNHDQRVEISPSSIGTRIQ